MAKEFSVGKIATNWASWKINLVDGILGMLPLLQISKANKLVAKYAHLKNDAFINAASKEIGISLELSGIENLPKTGAVTIVSNHPGGPDVLATISAIAKVRPDMVILANKLICIEPVKEIVIPVNPLANQKLDMAEVHKAYEAGKVVVFYAAGKNSRFDANGLLRDRKWRTTFLSFAKQYNTPINVLRIDAQNSPLFYKVSKFRERFQRLKNVPLENIFQLRELTRPVTMKLFLSSPFHYDKTNDSTKKMRETAEELYHFLYQMDENHLDLNAK